VTLSGLLEGAVDEEAFEGAAVTLEGAGSTISAADGSFTFTSIPTGKDLSLRVEKDGHLPLVCPLRMTGLSPEAAVTAFPLSRQFVADLPGGPEDPSAEVTAVMVELDALSATGGESASLSAKHGPVFVLAPDSDPIPGNVAPALGKGESVLVLFLDVAPGTTDVELSSPESRCVAGPAYQAPEGFPVIEGAVTFLYAECSASERVQREEEEAARGPVDPEMPPEGDAQEGQLPPGAQPAGETSDGTRPAP